MSTVLGEPARPGQVSRRPRWTAAAGSYGWLLLDQAVFAITNLVINLLFAHWLTPDEYGRFSVSFSGFILLSVLHWYVVVEPLLLESSRIRADQARAYVMTLLRAHLLLLAIAVVVAAACLFGLRALGEAELGLGIAASCGCGCALLTLVTARRLCLAFLSASVSAGIGVLYLLAATATAWLLHAAGAVGWIALWLVMSGWSLVCAGIICALLLRRPAGPGRYRLGDLLAATSRFAAWGSLTAGFSWIRSDGMYAVLAVSSGLSDVAQTRAIVMLTAPIWQMNSALNASWLMDFGRRRSGGGALSGAVLRCAGVYVVFAVVAVLCAVVLAGPVTHLAYGGRYDVGAWLLPLFLLACLLNGLEGMLTSAMKTRGVYRDSYLPQIVGSVTVGIVALAVVPLAGTEGAALAVLAGSVLGLAIAMVLLLRSRR